MKRKIDWHAVRASRERLDALAAAHPELRGESSAADWLATLEEHDAMADTTQTAFRLPNALLERLDRYVERLNKEQPGLTLSRADVVRMLLTRGLDAADPVPSATRSRKR